MTQKIRQCHVAYSCCSTFWVVFSGSEIYRVRRSVSEVTCELFSWPPHRRRREQEGSPEFVCLPAAPTGGDGLLSNTTHQSLFSRYCVIFPHSSVCVTLKTTEKYIFGHFLMAGQAISLITIYIHLHSSHCSLLHIFLNPLTCLFLWMFWQRILIILSGLYANSKVPKTISDS